MIDITIKKDNILSGFQWFFFIFCNTVLIPPTFQSAFNLSDNTTLILTQYSFIATGLGCLLQVFYGHQRAIMEGPTGLWWATILSITAAEASQGISLSTIGGNIAIGIAAAGLITLFIGLSGAGAKLAGLFKPTVMAVFMFMLGAQLIGIFLKGMLGIPFGVLNSDTVIRYDVFLLALIILVIVLAVILFCPQRVSKYAILIGILIGWGSYALLFGQSSHYVTQVEWHLFPLGAPDVIRPGIIITCILAGLLNITNTFGTIRGTENFYPKSRQINQIYRRSFITTGAVTLAISPLAVVPFAPFVSSIGLITQTRDSSRRSFFIGSVLFLVIGFITPFASFFSTLPLAIGSAVQ